MRRGRVIACFTLVVLSLVEVLGLFNVYERNNNAEVDDLVAWVSFVFIITQICFNISMLSRLIKKMARSNHA